MAACEGDEDPTTDPSDTTLDTDAGFDAADTADGSDAADTDAGDAGLDTADADPRDTDAGDAAPADADAGDVGLDTADADTADADAGDTDAGDTDTVEPLAGCTIEDLSTRSLETGETPALSFDVVCTGPSTKALKTTFAVLLGGESGDATCDDEPDLDGRFGCDVTWPDPLEPDAIGRIELRVVPDDGSPAILTYLGVALDDERLRDQITDVSGAITFPDDYDGSGNIDVIETMAVPGGGTRLLIVTEEGVAFTVGREGTIWDPGDYSPSRFASWGFDDGHPIDGGRFGNHGAGVFAIGSVGIDRSGDAPKLLVEVLRTKDGNFESPETYDATGPEGWTPNRVLAATWFRSSSLEESDPSQVASLVHATYVERGGTSTSGLWLALHLGATTKVLELGDDPDGLFGLSQWSTADFSSCCSTPDDIPGPADELELWIQRTDGDRPVLEGYRMGDAPTRVASIELDTAYLELDAVAIDIDGVGGQIIALQNGKGGPTQGELFVALREGESPTYQEASNVQTNPLFEDGGISMDPPIGGADAGRFTIRVEDTDGGVVVTHVADIPVAFGERTLISPVVLERTIGREAVDPIPRVVDPNVVFAAESGPGQPLRRQVRMAGGGRTRAAYQARPGAPVVFPPRPAATCDDDCFTPIAAFSVARASASSVACGVLGTEGRLGYALEIDGLLFPVKPEEGDGLSGCAAVAVDDDRTLVLLRGGDHSSYGSGGGGGRVGATLFSRDEGEIGPVRWMSPESIRDRGGVSFVPASVPGAPLRIAYPGGDALHVGALDIDAIVRALDDDSDGDSLPMDESDLRTAATGVRPHCWWGAPYDGGLMTARYDDAVLAASGTDSDSAERWERAPEAERHVAVVHTGGDDASCTNWQAALFDPATPDDYALVTDDMPGADCSGLVVPIATGRFGPNAGPLVFVLGDGGDVPDALNMIVDGKLGTPYPLPRRIEDVVCEPPDVVTADFDGDGYTDVLLHGQDEPLLWRSRALGDIFHSDPSPAPRFEPIVGMTGAEAGYSVRASGNDVRIRKRPGRVKYADVTLERP